MMLREPAVLHALLAHLTEALVTYVCHQIDCGAQVPLQPPRCRVMHCAPFCMGAWFDSAAHALRT